MKKFSKYIQYYKSIAATTLGLMYITVGIKHFTDPETFIAITPPFIYFREAAVYFTGLVEITGGALLLVKKYRRQGGVLIIILLFLFLLSTLLRIKNQDGPHVFAILEI